jgi:hypothetical protein
MVARYLSAEMTRQNPPRSAAAALPDPKSTDIHRRIRRQCLALHGTPADREAIDFIEAITEEEHWWQ